MSHATWAIVPAAGIGKRMQSDIPKQYLSLNGRPVLEYTVNTLLQNKNITGLVVALQQDDIYWHGYPDRFSEASVTGSRW